MEAIGLFFSKFSDELLSAQIAMLSVCLALAIYWLLVRKKKRETTDWVPAALVRAYLDRMRNDECETRLRLFGEDYSAKAPSMPLTQMLNSAGGAAPVTQMVVSNDPALKKEIEALRAQLAIADSRVMESDRTLNGLRAEKGVLEQKVKDAQTAAAAAPAAGGTGEPDPAMLRELEDLRARIQEYDVVSEEIANIKILQKENDKLKQRIGQLETGAPTLTVVPGGAEAPTPTVTISNAPAKTEAAPVAATPPPPAAETNTNVLTPPPPPSDGAAPPAAVTQEKSSKQKEEELLSEFEKMLAS